jgi:Zn-dependent protease/predicted transcriptional regulator
MMFGRRLELFRLFGFKVRVDVSWLVIAFLVSWSLASGVFPTLHPDWSTAMHWAMGIGGALGLFASIIVHEFAHSLVARRFGIPMEGITLFIFGGVAEMREEPPSPKAEFWMAVAGPAASLAVAGACFAAALAGGALGAPESVSTVVGYLATINVILAVFNMMPAFPLDGGRVLRSVLWGWKENIRWATRVSSQIGIAFGALLIVLGLFSLLNGQLVGGLWWILIGLFVRQGAQGSYRQLLMRREFEGEPVRRFMSRDPITVETDTSIEELVENHVYRHHHKLYPVVENGRLVGCVTTREIKEIPRDEWRQRTVGSAARPCSGDNTVSADDDAMKALSIMKRSTASRLMVVDGDRLIGVLGLKDLLDFFSLKMELEDES